MTRLRAGGERLLALENDPAHDQRVTCDEGSGQKHNEIIHVPSLTIARARSRRLLPIAGHFLRARN